MPLLDTSHLIGLLRKEKKSLFIQKNLDESREYQYISVITLLELTAGAYRSHHPDKKILEITIIKEHVDVIPVSDYYAEIYAVLVNKMRNNGSRIGELDELLAATALGIDGKIVTRDSHFASCPGIDVILY